MTIEGQLLASLRAEIEKLEPRATEFCACDYPFYTCNHCKIIEAERVIDEVETAASNAELDRTEWLEA